jgi:hypothetical protein
VLKTGKLEHSQEVAMIKLMRGFCVGGNVQVGLISIQTVISKGTSSCRAGDQWMP